MTADMSTATRKLRILEFGYPLFRTGAPEQTDYFWAERKKRGGPLFGPRAIWETLKRLRRGNYDLVAMSAPEFSPFHPRSFLTAVRDWHVEAPAALLAILAVRYMHHFHSVPLAVIDMRDTFGIPSSSLGLVDRSTVFFKRELPADRWQAFFKTRHWDLPGARWRSRKKAQRWLDKLAPLSLGYYPLEPIEPVEKTADVFFAGDVFPNSTVRSDGIKELLALREEGIVVDIPDGRLDRETFQKRLAGAWLGWSPAGYGWDCYRHYEAAVLGTVPLINYPTLKRYQPLVEGEHCLFYGVEPGGLAQTIRTALGDKERLKQISVQAQAHVLDHHTFVARAEHVAAAVLGRRLDGSPV